MSHPVQPTRFSDESDPGVPDSLWAANDFMLGAGMVILQPSTGDVVVLSDERTDARGRKYTSFFLPKGRKDIGESLEQTALREAYEESGLRVTFMPLLISTHAPSPPSSRSTLDQLLPSTEPIFLDLHQWRRGHFGRGDAGGEYLTFWYVGQVPENAVPETGTRMPDEVGYKTHLVSHSQAMQLLAGTRLDRVVNMAYHIWLQTHETMRMPEWKEYVRNRLGGDPERAMAEVPPLPDAWSAAAARERSERP